MSRVITISELEYQKLIEENNSLREFVNGVLAGASKLKSGNKGARVKGPKVQKAERMAKMTAKELREFFKKDIK